MLVKCKTHIWCGGILMQAFHYTKDTFFLSIKIQKKFKVFYSCNLYYLIIWQFIQIKKIFFIGKALLILLRLLLITKQVLDQSSQQKSWLLQQWFYTLQGYCDRVDLCHLFLALLVITVLKCLLLVFFKCNNAK